MSSSACHAFSALVWWPHPPAHLACPKCTWPKDLPSSSSSSMPGTRVRAADRASSHEERVRSTVNIEHPIRSIGVLIADQVRDLEHGGHPPVIRRTQGPARFVLRFLQGLAEPHPFAWVVVCMDPTTAPSVTSPAFAPPVNTASGSVAHLPNLHAVRLTKIRAVLADQRKFVAHLVGQFDGEDRPMRAQQEDTNCRRHDGAVRRVSIAAASSRMSSAISLKSPFSRSCTNCCVRSNAISPKADFRSCMDEIAQRSSPAPIARTPTIEMRSVRPDRTLLMDRCSWR
jgi:hypothetical protein